MRGKGNHVWCKEEDQEREIQFVSIGSKGGVAPTCCSVVVVVVVVVDSMMTSPSLFGRWVEDWRVTPTECNLSSQRSARSAVSEKTVATDCNISTDSQPKFNSLMEVSCSWGDGPRVGDEIGDCVVVVVETGVEVEFNIAHRLGRARINVRTLALACSGRPVPAYLLMTSTTFRNVSMTSFLIDAKVPAGLLVVVVVDTVREVEDPVARDTKRVRRRCICCSICWVAYYPWI